MPQGDHLEIKAAEAQPRSQVTVSYHQHGVKGQLLCYNRAARRETRRQHPNTLV